MYMNCTVCKTYSGILIQHEVCPKRSFVCCPLCHHKGHLASECLYVKPGHGATSLTIEIDGTMDKSLRTFVHAYNERSSDNKIDVIKKRTNTSRQELLDAIKKWAVRKGNVLQFMQKVAYVSTLDISV
jgi:hypothetical protein